MLKRIVRGCLSRLQGWLDDDPEPPRSEYDENGFLYPYLNAHFTRMASKGLRQSYAWGMLQAVNLARALAVNRVSVIEFGVAGGNGLVALEQIADRVEDIFSVGIDIYGFDSGVGLPRSRDHRDVPNLTSEGLYTMDRKKLEQRLRRAQLVLGPINETMPGFLKSGPAPVAFVGCDLILYTSTVHALRLLDGDPEILLPRIHWYCDDVLGFTFGDHNGERLAISEFNADHETRKVSPIYGLKHYMPKRFANEMWLDKYWIAHLFDHPLYGQRDNLVKQHNLDLRAEPK
jgi:hypothetical protein